MLRLVGAGSFGIVRHRFPHVIKQPLEIAVAVAILVMLAGFIVVLEVAAMGQEIADMPVDWDVAGDR